MLTRLGNKSKLAPEIYSYFPEHKMRIELFFGAGGAFFNMPKAKYNILNDLDDDVTNLYKLVMNDIDRLKFQIERMPISASLLSSWKHQTFNDPFQKALRFLLISNFTYLGKGDTLRLGIDNTKQVLIDHIHRVFLLLKDCKITNSDFREVLPKISFTKALCTKENAFFYLDPVYLDTEHFYKVPKWTIKDTIDCFEIMSYSGIKCAMSEFDHPVVIEEANLRGFQIIKIKERNNIKNRRMELLIVNYEIESRLF